MRNGESLLSRAEPLVCAGPSSRSRIIRQLSQPMGVVLAWAALFGFYETCLEAGVLPSYLPK